MENVLKVRESVAETVGWLTYLLLIDLVRVSQSYSRFNNRENRNSSIGMMKVAVN
jgi:hypothetical protein